MDKQAVRAQQEMAIQEAERREQERRTETNHDCKGKTST